jgi:hypothetical protein
MGACHDVRQLVPASTASRNAMLITPFQMRKRAV